MGCDGMRDILFRGKRKDNGLWVEGGYYRHYTGQIAILTGDISPNHAAIMDEVDPETVGQYINRNDKTGTKIFEGAIVCTENHEDLDIIDEWGPKDFGYAVVEWSAKSGFVFRGNQICWSVDDAESVYALKYCKVIGNIHDNPELLASYGNDHKS